MYLVYRWFALSNLTKSKVIFRNALLTNKNIGHGTVSCNIKKFLREGNTAALYQGYCFLK